MRDIVCTMQASKGLCHSECRGYCSVCPSLCLCHKGLGKKAWAKEPDLKHRLQGFGQEAEIDGLGPGWKAWVRGPGTDGARAGSGYRRRDAQMVGRTDTPLLLPKKKKREELNRS